MLNFIHEADLRLLYLINSDSANPFLDWLMALVSDYGIWKWPLLIAAAALVIWGGYRERLLIVMTLALIVVGEGITGTIKRLTDRPRPYQHLENIRHVDLSGVRMSEPGPVQEGRSMPSGHVANNVAFAFLLTTIYGRGWRLIWMVAVTMAFSRIYVGSHYPSDVVVAFFLALGYSRATAWAARRLWQTVGPCWLAETYRRHPDLFPGEPGLV